jgi:hypothetical protein
MTENKSAARGSGKGGRGRSFKSREKSQTKTVAKKKTLTDYNFYVGSFKQASEYEITAEFIINHIRKTYEYSSDIGDALEYLKAMDKNADRPKLKISTETDADLKTAETEQFSMEFRADYDNWTKKHRMYEDNCTKAYALIWERCAKPLQNKI